MDLDKLQTKNDLEAYFDKLQGDLMHIWLKLDKIGWGIMWRVTFSADGVGEVLKSCHSVIDVIE